MERNLALEVIRVTEAGALFASRFVGRGDEKLAYHSSIDAMSKVFASVAIDGKIILGKAVDAATLLSSDMEVGCKSGVPVDLIVDPLDGMETCARGSQNSISAVAVGERGAFFKPPAMYMEKIAVGADAKGIIDINEPAEINIKRIARAKNKYIEDVTVCILDRDRHKNLVERIRKVGARIILIRDGDISGAVAASMEDKAIDILMGVGGSMEGILAAAAIKCLGGDMQARFVYDSKEKPAPGEENKVYYLSDLIKGDDVMFSATGVTDGELLKGVRYISGGAKTESIVMRSKTHTIRYIHAIHHFDYKPLY